MISRREVVTAGVLGTLASGAADASQSQSDSQLTSSVKALEDKLNELKLAVDQGLRGNSMSYGNVGQVKSAIEKYAKTGGKFPEYCEVGLSVFYDVYDWHVRHQQQIQITRIAEQRMAIQFMFTQLILRWENVETYVGTPYDR
ncbi:MAG: hypothetical protein ABI024_06385 [Vicinamibacterales bacterium]